MAPARSGSSSCVELPHTSDSRHTRMGRGVGIRKSGEKNQEKKKAPRTRSMTSFCQPTTKESPSSSYGVAVGAGHLVCVCVVRGAGLTCQIGRRKLSQHDWKSLTRSRKRETHERKRGNQVDSEARKECHKKLSKYKNDRQVKRTSCWYNLRINSLHYAKR